MSAVTATSASPPDALVNKVVDAIRSLAEGNISPGEQLVVRTTERTDRTVTLLLDVELGWKGDDSREASREHPKGSTPCDNKAATHARLREACDRAIIDPATAADLASVLRVNPVEEFRTRKDDAKVRDLSERFHWHERCGRCGGKGQHDCDNVRCSRGWTTCTACNGDGRGPCSGCGSTGSVWVNEARSNGDVSLTRQSCRACGGSGRAVYCTAC